ncbi:putative reverse transcriptase domain-containing protein [Tanacetum coccineum]
MATHSTGRGGAASRGGRTGERRGRGGGRGISGNDNIGNDGNNGDNANNGGNLDIAAMITQQLQALLSTIVTQISNGAINQGNGNGGSGDDNSGTLAYTRSVKKMESVINMSNCAINQRVKYVGCSLTGKVLTWWNTQVQDRGRETAIGITWDDFNALLRYIYGLVIEIREMVRATESSIIQSVILKVEGLTNDVVMDGLWKKGGEKRRDDVEPSKQRDTKMNNKRSRIRKGFMATNLGKNKYRSYLPKCAKLATQAALVNVDNPRACYECRSPDHLHDTCPKLNKASGQVRNNPNQDLAIGGNNSNRRNNGNPARDQAFALGANEALQDPIIMIGSFDMVVVEDFTKVFPEDLTGLPPLRQTEFRIDLIPEATLVAKAPYHLTSDILRNARVFQPTPRTPRQRIHSPESFTWGAPVLSVKKKDGSLHPYILAILKGSLDPVNPFIRQTAELRITKRGTGGYYQRFIENFSKIAQPLTLLTQKDKRFDWGGKQEESFQTLKDSLCSALILALPNGPNNFVVYCDASIQRLGSVLMQRGKVIAYASRQLKANVVADVLSRKEKVKPVHVRAMSIKICSGIKTKILESQMEAFKEINVQGETLQGLDKQMERKEDGALYFVGRIWVPLAGNVRTLAMDEAHKTRYSIHPRADKMYHDLRDMY